MYLREVYVELVTKVTWPSWKDLQSSAILVMVVSLIFALVVFLMDSSFKFIIEFIYELLLGSPVNK